MFIHIDCNNFFVSCELVSRPDLQGTPVVVANDNETGGGIILALNKEAKAIGLKRGNPLFQVREIIDKQHVSIIDVHHSLYHQISNHIMEVVHQSEMVLDFVQYSVDEFFGTMPDDDPERLRTYLQQVKDLIMRETHIPVSCGAGHSYTLAKTATHFAKRYNGYNGICIMPMEKRQRALEMLAANDVWGLGRRSKPLLEQLHITTAWQFAQQDKETIQRLFGVRGVRTWMELNGTPAIVLEGHEKQKSIMHSRTFAHMFSERVDLEREISNFVMAAASKLRAQKQLCQALHLFLATNRHREDLPQYKNDTTIRLTHPTDDTSLLIRTAIQALKQIYQKGYLYKQAGVVLEQLVNNDSIQMDLFTADDLTKKKRLMAAIDDINRKFGANQIHFAIQGQRASTGDGTMERGDDEPAGFMRAHKIK
jgi:DNA polymerase V